MLFNPEGVIQKYDTPEDVLREFYGLRLGLYAKRRASLLRAAEAELLRLSNKTRFIIAVVDGELVLSNRKRADIEADLEARGFDRLPSNKKKAAAAAAAAAEGEAEDGADAGAGAAESYDYLLSMSLVSLTLEKVEALQQGAAHVRGAGMQSKNALRMRPTISNTLPLATCRPTQTLQRRRRTALRWPGCTPPRRRSCGRQTWTRLSSTGATSWPRTSAARR